MPINLFNKFKEKEVSVRYIFLLSLAYFIIVIFSYLIILLKMYIQENEIATLQKDASSYTTDQQKTYEDKFSQYKKKISDFSTLVNDHKVSSNVFSFLEEKTFPNVWFYDFSLLEDTSELSLSGEAKDADTFSKQIAVFEKSSYVKSVNVLDSRPSDNGGILFTLKISLDPKIFDYTVDQMMLNQ